MYLKRKSNLLFSFVFVLISGTFLFHSCKQKPETTEKGVSVISLDSTAVAPFFESYSEMKKYEEEYQEIYDHYDFHYIWFNENGMVDYGKSLYNQVKDLEEEGIYFEFPYQEKIDAWYAEDIKNPEENPDAELLMTGLYLFYLNHVYKGIDSKITGDLGWLIPRKDIDDTDLLDALIQNEEVEEKDSLMFDQYYQLKEELKRFQKIQKDGGWNEISSLSDKSTLKPKDSSETIRQIRNRLYITGELEKNNESKIYDDELMEGIFKFQKHHGLNRDSIISNKHITALNIPVREYIKKIVVNMERSRWLPQEFSTADEKLLVNIPAFHLDYYRDGEIILESEVVVGSEMTKTVIFDGEISYLAFSPYWNIPQSIIKNEVIPGMERDENYLKNRNMEWNDGQVRQLPGGNNSLGLVKFMFPNSNSIYLHDTPAKSLFKNEDRARSHGCIRVAKARDLAITILDEDKEWNQKKIDAAMHAGKESTYELKKKIPVYIGYFTAWVDKNGEINFYEDIYKRDDKLADLLSYRQ